jgi:DNA-binding NarL/FixJ family response regulator
MTITATRIPVLLIATDPILRNGLRTTLDARPEIRVVDEGDSSPDTVAIVASDRIDEHTEQTLRALQHRHLTKVVLITGDFDDADVLAAVGHGVHAVAGRAHEPNGARVGGCTDRETEVLRLLAAGLSTSEIARQLSYSQRTIKSIVHDVTNRFQLRNRSHAVAFAVREGLI